MNLLIDAGNTRVKWGLHDGAVWHARGAVPTATPEALEAALAVQPVPARVMGANVAGASVALAVGRLCAAWKRTPGWLVPGIEAGGVRNAYLDPTQLGPDRWAALIGARTLHAGAALVVTAGTATTVDVLTAEGVFRGGIILPGLELMRRALARDTARLPFADGCFDATPRRTADAIVSGCLHAQAGAIERMFRLVADAPDAVCLLNGGAAADLGPQLGCPVRQVDNLVLEGLARLTSGK